MSRSNRAKRREDVEEAYRIQLRAGAIVSTHGGQSIVTPKKFEVHEYLTFELYRVPANGCSEV